MTSKDRATQPKLKLVVLGATGATGQLIVSQEPEQGHHVTAPARHSEAVAARHPQFRLKTANGEGLRRRVIQENHVCLCACWVYIKRDMTESSQRPLARRLQARVMRLVNAPMRIILGLRVATPLSKRLMLAFIIGRKSGKTYRQPLSYVKDGNTLLTPGGGRWKLNLRDGHPVRLRLRGRDVLARPKLVGDIDEVDRLLSVILAANPSAGSFVRIAKSPDGCLDREGLRTAIHYGFRIVRWHLDEARDVT